MGLTFTKTDKALIDRAARHMADQAKDLHRSTTVNGAWPNTKSDRATKAYHDRLLRDERDLRQMAKRLLTAEVGEKQWHQALLGLPLEMRMMYLKGNVNADGTYKENPNGKVCLAGEILDPATLTPEQLKYAITLSDPTWDKEHPLYDKSHG